MSELPDRQRPVTFKLDDPDVKIVASPAETADFGLGTVRVAPEADASALAVITAEPMLPTRRRFRWGATFWTAVGGLLLLGLGLSATRLVEDLFSRNEELGYLGAALLSIAALSLLVVISREALGLMRLATIESLHRRATEAILTDDRDTSRKVVSELLVIAHQNPYLAHARAMLTEHSNDIIDGADMIRLAERQLMAPLDQEAQRLVSTAAKRVSIVTAISPRALVDVLFVLAASLRLIRQIARLYGGRPGVLGLISLVRHVISHLAITGGLAASDSLIQQMLGHGVAAKVSSRLGEGILNGLLTARLGLAAIEVTRPLPFTALPRPVLGDLAKDLLRRKEGDR